MAENKWVTGVSTPICLVVSTHLKKINQNWIISPGRNENEKCLSCHHLDRVIGPHFFHRWLWAHLVSPHFAPPAWHAWQPGWKTGREPSCVDTEISSKCRVMSRGRQMWNPNPKSEETNMEWLHKILGENPSSPWFWHETCLTWIFVLLPETFMKSTHLRQNLSEMKVCICFLLLTKKGGAWEP